jgi:hypothetical protein
MCLSDSIDRWGALHPSPVYIVPADLHAHVQQPEDVHRTCCQIQSINLFLSETKGLIFATHMWYVSLGVGFLIFWSLLCSASFFLVFPAPHSQQWSIELRAGERTAGHCTVRDGGRHATRKGRRVLWFLWRMQLSAGSLASCLHDAPDRVKPPNSCMYLPSFSA